MSDGNGKRVAFTTLGPINGSSSAGASGGGGLKDMTKKGSSFQGDNFARPTSYDAADSLSSASHKTSTPATKRSKTTRLVMELFEPNSNAFPEFNFSKLMHLEKKKQKKLKQKANGFANLEERDDDVERIAKELEKKYGASYGSARGRNKKDDFCDIGHGYDESDSFIDNTEAYDEIIPEEVETVEGGFYINSGALEFKRLSNYDKTDEIIKMPKARKRALSSSSEDSTDASESERRRKSQTTTNSKDTASKVKPGPIEKRLKSTEGKDKEKTKIKIDKNTDSAKEKSVKTTTVKDMLKAKRDSFFKMQEGEGKSKASNGEIKSSQSSEDGSAESESVEDSDSEEGTSEKKVKSINEDDTEKLRTGSVSLPDGLSEELLQSINLVVNTAKSNNRLGKNFEFDNSFTQLFLRIDDDCIDIEKPIRNLVFAHLEYQLCLPKYMLLRKAKQLRMKEEKAKTRRAFIKLKKKVESDMGPLLQQYELKLRKINEVRESASTENIQKTENILKQPKKKFIWNDIIRNFLYELYQIRCSSYNVLQTRKETLSDFVCNYIKDKVVALWPAGWMKYEELKKEISKKTKLQKCKKIEVINSVSTSDKTQSKNSPIISIIEENSSSSTNSGSSSTTSSSKDAVPNIPKKLSDFNSVPQTGSPRACVSNASTNENNQAKEDPQNSIKAASTQNVPTSTSKLGAILDRTNTPQGSSNNSVIDLVSPSKRTDHSINSLLSSSQNSSASTSPSGAVLKQHSSTPPFGSKSPSNSAIDIDNFKGTSDIMSTSNKILNNNTESFLHGGRQSIAAAGDSSSESDCVEIVDVYQAAPSVKKIAHTKLKQKVKTPCDSVAVGPTELKSSNTKQKNITKTIKVPENLSESDTIESKDTDLEVNKILKALRELEEIQQSGGINSTKNINHSSANFNKDARQ